MEAAINVFHLTFVVFALFVGLNAQRKVTTTLREPPEALNITETIVIAHIQAIGAHDAIHHLITTIGIPTVLVARTSTDAKLDIDWDKLLSHDHKAMADSIKFDKVFYSYAVAFTRLIDYDDVDDSAYLPPAVESDQIRVYNLSDFVWENMTAESDPAANMVMINATVDGPETVSWAPNGSFALKFRGFDKAGRDDMMPHLQYNDNATLFDLIIDKFYTNFTISRFAIEMAVIGDGVKAMDIDHSQSLDDEYTPGVFKIFNLLTRPSHAEDTGFLQWKPVCYTSPSRGRQDGTGMKFYGDGTEHLHNSQQAMINDSIIYAFYGKSLMNVWRTPMNFSFGLSKDGGYNKTRYLTWSASIGYGKPPEDVISTLVIVVISTGLGLPVVLIIGGGIFVCVKKRKVKEAKPLQNTDEYKPIIN